MLMLGPLFLKAVETILLTSLYLNFPHSNTEDSIVVIKSIYLSLCPQAKAVYWNFLLSSTLNSLIPDFFCPF